MDFGPSALIALIGSDGVVRSSGGSSRGLALGQDLASTKLFTRMRDGTSVTFDDNGSPKEAARLVTIRKVKGHPLWVSVSVDKQQIYEVSWATLKLNATVAAALPLLILAAMER